ncbi:MAG: helix-turn-helix transcriptional regulator [Chloroflexi bacterium]|nr:helix-turn-helix transcriptional regulator [Chloroflexota bacterium]
MYLARQEAGLSQDGLANRIGTTQDAVSLYERGARSVSLDTLISTARALDKTLDYFLEVHDSLVVVRDSRL